MKKRSNGKGGENLDGLAFVMNQRADAYDRRQANAMKRRAFGAGAYRLDDRREGDEGTDEREDRLLSDHGRGATVIRLMGEEEDWVREVNRVLDTLDGVELLIAEALTCDQRPAHAARRAGTNRMRVYRTMAKLREELALAHQLYRLRNADETISLGPGGPWGLHNKHKQR